MTVEREIFMNAFPTSLAIEVNSLLDKTKPKSDTDEKYVLNLCDKALFINYLRQPTHHVVAPQVIILSLLFPKYAKDVTVIINSVRV